MGLRVQPWMPVVTRVRVGWVVGTGVLARGKSRIPAAPSAKPVRAIRDQADQKSGEKEDGGSRVTPAVLVSFTCCSAVSLLMDAPADAVVLRGRDLHLEYDNHGVK
jgi:hypothetical protein